MKARFLEKEGGMRGMLQKQLDKRLMLVERYMLHNWRKEQVFFTLVSRETQEYKSKQRELYGF